MTRAQKTILGVLAISACSVWLVVLYFTGQWYRAWSQKPLGPALAYPTQLQLPATWIATLAFEAATQSTGTLAPALNFETQTTVPPFLYCSNSSPTMTILALGTDVRPGQSRPGLTDVMRAVRVDFQGQRVTTLEFPRDMWVKIPEIKDTLKTDHQKLNTAYAY